MSTQYSASSIDIAGTAKADSTVTLYNNGNATVGSTTADGTGNWQINNIVLTDGSNYNFTATVTDPTGNTSGSSNALVLHDDQTAPNAPVITTTAPAQNTLSSIDIAGTAEANSTVTLFNSASVVGKTTADGSGNWNVNGIALTSGHYIFTATATDAAGNTSGPSGALIFDDIQNDAPVINANGGTLAYTENQAAAAIDTVLTVSDVDSANLTGATVSITNNFVTGQDVLGFTNQNGISGIYNSTTGVLTLSGSASVAAYQAALQSVTYLNSSDNPSGLTRTLSFQVNDGSASNNLSNVATTTVAVTPVNDAPVINANGGTLAYTENQAAAAIDTVLTVSDVDSANLTGATVSITNNFVTGQDVLGFTNQNGISGIYNSTTGVLTLSGSASVAAYQAALQSVTYLNSSDNPSGLTRTLSFQVNDGSASNNLSNVATTTVAVTPVNDAPVINANGGTLAYTENQAAAAIDTVLTVSDVDSANLTGATVSITNNFVTGQDVLGFTNQNGISGIYNSTTGVLTLSGSASVAAYQAALQSVTYLNSSDNPSGLTRTLSFQVNDGSASNNLSNVATTTVAVTPVNDAPVNTVPAGPLTVNEDIALAFTSGNTISAHDVDGNLASTQLTVLHGTLTVSLAGGASISAGADGSNTLTLSGNADADQYSVGDIELPGRT